MERKSCCWETYLSSFRSLFEARSSAKKDTGELWTTKPAKFLNDLEYTIVSFKPVKPQEV